MIHPDSQTNAPDTDYFFLGNGKLLAIVQWSRCGELSPLGVLIYDPERMTRKYGSLLFHPELGLSRTMLTVIADGVRYHPEHARLEVDWAFDPVPSVIARWRAGSVMVAEQFAIQNEASGLLRTVTLSGVDGHHVEVEAAYYANPLYFDQFGTHPGSVLYAQGYSTLSLDSVPSGRAFERFLTVTPDTGPGDRAVTFIYTLNAVGSHDFALYPEGPSFPTVPPITSHSAESEPMATAEAGAVTGIRSELAGRIDRLFRVSRVSLRAAVSSLGRFDASIWQYDFEWGMDASMVAMAATMSGQLDLARQVILNILRRLTNDQGQIAEAGRFRSGELSELNGNGAVLDAIHHYWRLSGDVALVRGNWRRIAAIADYPLLPEFEHPSGLLNTRRDFWERYPWMGVGDGFELGHQVFCSVGLQRAAELATATGHPDKAQLWSEASIRIRTAMLTDPRFSLIDNGTFIRRRLIDGSVQTSLSAVNDYSNPEYAPYIPASAGEGPDLSCEPDVTEMLPIVYGLVDPHDDLALATVEKMRKLWSPTGIGGYARYDLSSDPDSPGPWPFATAFVAGAELDSGFDERATETISWLIDRAGTGGSWLEFYGKRAPPYPPIGIIVWGWAQWLILVVRHMVGVRVEPEGIFVSPKLVGLEHTLRIGEHAIRLTVSGLATGRLDGAPVELVRGGVMIPWPIESSHHIEFLP